MVVVVHRVVVAVHMIYAAGLIVGGQVFVIVVDAGVYDRDEYGRVAGLGIPGSRAVDLSWPPLRCPERVVRDRLDHFHPDFWFDIDDV